MVTMDPTELTQVVINVVANAAQALQRRDVPGGSVTVNLSEDDENVTFIVRDDGPGMPPDVLAKVGTPFFTTRQSGTGLGVMQSRRLVEKARGQFKIESEQGVGTTVTFTVPKARQ